MSQGKALRRRLTRRLKQIHLGSSSPYQPRQNHQLAVLTRLGPLIQFRRYGLIAPLVQQAQQGRVLEIAAANVIDETEEGVILIRIQRDSHFVDNELLKFGSL